METIGILNRSLEDFIEKTRHRNTGSKYIGSYHPSHIPYCLRRVFYDFKIGREFPMIVKKKMEAGNVFHAWFREILGENEEIKILECEVPHEKWFEEFKMIGTPDYYVEIDGKRSVIDVKSTLWGADVNWPKPNHIMQINFYQNFFERCDGYLLYIGRADLVVRTFRTQFDEDLYDSTIKRARELHHYLTENILPVAEGLNTWQCENCPYVPECRRGDKDGKEQSGHETFQEGDKKRKKVAKATGN